MSPGKPEPVSIAILARAPVPGRAKTRLIPLLGAHGAAAFAENATRIAVALAAESRLGPVTLWVTPEITHPLFRELASVHKITVRRQPDGDLGLRMLAACEAADGPVLVIGTDCPAMGLQHLREAAQALHGGNDAVAIPAEDGGYVLIGMRRPQPALFENVAWGTETVMAATRRHATGAGLRLHELPPLWDIDRPEDFERLRGDARFAQFF